MGRTPVSTTLHKPSGRGPLRPLSHLGLTGLLPLLLLAACQPEGGGPQGGSDTTAPTLVRTSPMDGAMLVATDTPLRLVFSEGMNRDSVALNLEPAVPLSAPAWLGGESVRFTPQGGWPEGATVAVTVVARDLAGNQLVGATTFSFQVAAEADIEPPPAPVDVRATSLEGGFLLEWDDAPEGGAAGHVAAWGVEAGAPDAAAFVPAGETSLAVMGLVNGLEYHYLLFAEDASGNQSEAVSGSVTPLDVTPPVLLSSLPVAGDSAPASLPFIRLVFSEPMDTADEAGQALAELCFNSGTVAEPECGEALTGFLGEFGWDAPGTTLTIPLEDELPDGRDYALFYSLFDSAGNAASGPGSLPFSVAVVPDETRPTVIDWLVLPNSTTARLWTAFVFSEPMDQASVEAALITSPPLSCAWTWLDGELGPASGGTGSGVPAPQVQTAICDVIGTVQQHTEHSFTFSTHATDLAGNPLVPWTFIMTTGNFRPRIVAHTPFNPITPVSQTTPITVTFSEPMDQTSMQFTVTNSSGPVAGIGFWTSSPALVWRFEPTVGYGAGQIVTWTVTTAADESGLELAEPFSRSFTTQSVLDGAGGF